MELTQKEANALIALAKHYFGTDIFTFPPNGESVRIPLFSENKKEEFMLDISRGKVKLTKSTFQNRARKVIILFRLDIDGSEHMNPNEERIPSPHLHVYREGYGDKWAYPVPLDKFKNLNDPLQVLEDFMDFCNIITKPHIRGNLF